MLPAVEKVKTVHSDFVLSVPSREGSTASLLFTSVRHTEYVDSEFSELFRWGKVQSPTARDCSQVLSDKIKSTLNIFQKVGWSKKTVVIKTAQLPLAPSDRK
jgi:hypothetical protein